MASFYHVYSKAGQIELKIFQKSPKSRKIYRTSTQCHHLDLSEEGVQNIRFAHGFFFRKPIKNHYFDYYYFKFG